MDLLLSCDWGTSTFRLKLADAKLNILATVCTADGISASYNLWRTSREKNRVPFYLDIIARQIATLETQLGRSLAGVPVALSGMASSSIGMMELPYATLPFNTNGADVKTANIKRSPAFEHDVLLISGLRGENDVMRGEETQLIGCIGDDRIVADEQQMVIFPGTHSKHILVVNRQVTTFKTYLTGEIFNLLISNSILKDNVAKPEHISTALNQSFDRGVNQASGSNVLNALFRVRTNGLFSRLSKEENYTFLSGLLIGTELNDIIPPGYPVSVCCTSELYYWYSRALKNLAIANDISPHPPAWAQHTALYGQYKILSKLGVLTT